MYIFTEAGWKSTVNREECRQERSLVEPAFGLQQAIVMLVLECVRNDSSWDCHGNVAWEIE